MAVSYPLKKKKAKEYYESTAWQRYFYRKQNRGLELWLSDDPACCRDKKGFKFYRDGCLQSLSPNANHGLLHYIYSWAK